MTDLGTCDEFWREGVLRVEQGLPDPHRATCLTCRRAFEDHQALVHALGEIGRDVVSAPGWQARVWRELERRPRPERWRWWLPGGFAAAATALVMCLTIAHRAPETAPRIEILPGLAAVRTRAVHAGDRLRVTARASDEIRIYRGEHLMLTCRDGTIIPSCLIDHDLVADLVLDIPGTYQVVVITRGGTPSASSLDHDLASLRSAGAAFELTEVTVR